MHPGDEPVDALKSWLRANQANFHNASFSPWRDNVIITAPVSAVQSLLHPDCKLVLRKHPERAQQKISLQSPYDPKDHELSDHLWRVTVHGSHTPDKGGDDSQKHDVPVPAPLATRAQLPLRREAVNHRGGLETNRGSRRTGYPAYDIHYWPPTQPFHLANDFKWDANPYGVATAATFVMHIPLICPHWPSYEVPMSSTDFSNLPVSPTADPIQPCASHSSVYNTTEQLLGYNITFIPEDGGASVGSQYFPVDFSGTYACFQDDVYSGTGRNILLTNGASGAYPFTFCEVYGNDLALEEYKHYYVQIQMVFSDEHTLPQVFLDGLTYNYSAYVPGATSQDGEPLSARTGRSIAYPKLNEPRYHPRDSISQPVAQELKDFYSIPNSTATQWDAPTVTNVAAPTQGILSPYAPTTGFYVASSIDSFRQYYNYKDKDQSSSNITFIANPNATVPCWNDAEYGTCTTQTLTFIPEDHPETTMDLQYITAIASGISTELWHGGYFSPTLDVSYGGEDGPDYLLGIFLAMQYATPPSVVSLSYGAPEVNASSKWYNYDKDADDALKALGVMGTSVIVASGDTGSHLPGFFANYTPSEFCAASVIAWPASSPYVSAAELYLGRTQLFRL